MQLWTVLGGAKVAWLYCISESDDPTVKPCKVGVATKLKSRLASLQGGNHRPLYVIWAVSMDSRIEALNTEISVLSRLRQSSEAGRLCSEWVNASPDQAFALASEHFDPNQLLRVAP